MNSVVRVKTYPAPPVCKREVLRYAGCREAEAGIAALLDSCLAEVEDKLTYKVCWRELPVEVTASGCDFGVFALPSKELAQNLAGCKSVLLFAATVGVEMDRRIAKYSRIAPSRALLMQAIGAERIEALCDAFCREQGASRPRFSPGYGDLPLESQRELFRILDCQRKLGLCLNESLLMSPSKSATAFAGLAEGESGPQNKCGACDKNDGSFRRV